MKITDIVFNQLHNFEDYVDDIETLKKWSEELETTSITDFVIFIDYISDVLGLLQFCDSHSETSLTNIEIDVPKDGLADYSDDGDEYDDEDYEEIDLDPDDDLDEDDEYDDEDYEEIDLDPDNVDDSSEDEDDYGDDDEYEDYEETDLESVVQDADEDGEEDDEDDDDTDYEEIDLEDDWEKPFNNPIKTINNSGAKLGVGGINPSRQSGGSKEYTGIPPKPALHTTPYNGKNQHISDFHDNNFEGVFNNDDGVLDLSDDFPDFQLDSKVGAFSKPILNDKIADDTMNAILNLGNHIKSLSDMVLKKAQTKKKNKE